MADTRYITQDKWSSPPATEVTYPSGRQVASGYDALYGRNSVTETSGGGSIAAWDFFGIRTAKVALAMLAIWCCSFLAANAWACPDQASEQAEQVVVDAERQLANCDNEITRAIVNHWSSRRVGDLRIARMKCYQQVAPSLINLLIKREAELRSLTLEADDATARVRTKQAQIDRLRRLLTFVNSIGMKFAYILPGEFDMGSPVTEDGRESDENLHHVKITKSFSLATTSVTQAEWTSVVGNNPSSLQGEHRPVEMVSWVDAVAFCEILSAKEGRQYRLPTEAEWEYACRAGARTAFGGNQLDDVGWYADNSNDRTHPVAQKKPNAWGLYDMHGNVWQWCSDGYGPYGEIAVDPKGAKDFSFYVLRGGCWHLTRHNCRSASRFWEAPNCRQCDIGFRICFAN